LTHDIVMDTIYISIMMHGLILIQCNPFSIGWMLEMVGDLNLNCCLRGKMQQQCIKYLGPNEREQYKVIVDDGKLLYKQSGQL
ncbi:hypothetical protein KI387_007540, partial [Taxus chinensis]